LALIVVVGCAFVILFVNSERGHRYLLALAQQKAADALGVPVLVQNYTLHPYTLSADLYGIRIAGAAPHDDLPLLEADHLKVGIRIVSLLTRTWYLDQIMIDHPVAWVVVDKNGVSNLPVFKSNGSSHTDVFDLGIRRVQITKGEVYYNSRPSALAADLHDVAFDSTFSSLLRQYSGRLAYSNGVLTIGSLRPLPHNLEAEFAATPTTFTLKHGTLTAGPSSASMNATVENYGNPTVKAQYQIILDGKQAAQILGEPSMPTGSVQTSGSLQFQQVSNRSAIESLAVSGNLNSRQLAVNAPSVRASVENLSANYSLAQGNASLTNLRGQIMGGSLEGNGTMQAIGGNSHSNLQLDLHKVSLAELELSLGKPSSVNAVSVHGAANATATATWGKTIDNLVARADLTLDGNATRAHSHLPLQAAVSSASGSAASPTVPLQGVFHAVYTNADQSLALRNSFLKSSQLNLSLNGTISRQSSLAVNLQADDLNEVATLVDLVRASAPNASVTNLKGQATFQGNVRGSVTSPNLSGQLTARNLEYNGALCRQLTTQVGLSNSRASLQNLRIEGMDHNGQITGSASIDLANWTVTKESTAQVDLTASGLQMTTVSELAGTSLPVTGTVNANAHLHGAVMAPTGNASMHLASATAFGEPISQAKVDLAGSGNQVKATASVELPAGSIQAQVTTDPRARTYNAQVTSNGIDVAKLATIRARGLDAKGVVGIHARGQGSYDDPALDADLDIPTLVLSGQTISKTRLQLSAAHHVANVNLASSVAGTEMQGLARIDLVGDYNIDGSLNMPSMSIAPILAAFEPDEDLNLTGQAELHATFHGPLKNKNILQAQVKIPTLNVAYGNTIQLAASPIQVDFQQGTIRLQPVTFHGTDTDLNIQGVFPVYGSAPATLQAKGTVDLKLATIFNPDLRAYGQLKVNVDSHGTTADSLLNGEIDVADATVATTTSPVSLQHANGELQLTGSRLTIAKFQGVLGGGSLIAQGGVTFRPSLQLNLGAAVKGAQLLYPDGVRETVDAALRLTGTATNATLGGAVTLSNLSFTPAFDLNSVVNQLSGGVQVPRTSGFQQNLQLNIAVNSTSDASLASRSLSVDGRANLQIRGTAAEPVVLGRVSLTSGDVILNGNRFVLTGGTVQFINPSMTEPVLNISLTTTIKEYKIDLRFRGPADRLRTQYTSTPSLPSADIINLLAFGQTTEASAMNATPMDQQAEGLVASQVASQVSSRISKAAGISQLSISPVIAGGTSAGPPGANLTIQQRVTGNLFVTFSTNVASTQGQTIQGQYQVSPRVTVSATRDPNGGFAVDTLIKKSW
jgi:translocation and assembly module TamB